MPVPSTEFNWPLLITGVSIFTALLSISISAWLYYWRRALLASPDAIVPEKWANILKQNTKIVMDGVEINNAGLNQFAHELAQQSKLVEALNDIQMGMNEKLNEKDAEINRLKLGYDMVIYRNFLRRFIRVDKNIEEILSRDKIEASDISGLHLLMEDALEECHISKESPQIGDDYRRLGDLVADGPKSIITDDPDLDYQIAAIVSPAYIIQSDEGRTVVAPAEVEIFHFNKS